MSYQTEFKCFSRYNYGKGDYSNEIQRLSIFGRVLDNEDGLMNIFVLRCSPNDKFSKKLASEVYEKFNIGDFSLIIIDNYTVKGITIDHADMTFHPLLFTIPIKDMKKPRQTFINFCLDNYYAKEEYLDLNIKFESKIKSRLV